MKLLLTSALLLAFAVSLSATDDETNEIYSCGFLAHTPAGILTGNCTTQSIPAPDFLSRWKFTLTIDSPGTPVAGGIAPDIFFDVVRTQCLEDGTFTTVIPLWGDFVVKPADPDYVRGNQACAPIWQVAPSMITLSRTSETPPTFQFLFEVRPADFELAQGVPTLDWIARYLQSFQRLWQPAGLSTQSAIERASPF